MLRRMSLFAHFSAGLLLAAICVSDLPAALVSGDTVQVSAMVADTAWGVYDSGPIQYYSGEFILQKTDAAGNVLTGADAMSFKTFCLEKNVDIYPAPFFPGIYTVHSVSGETLGGYTLEAATKWLYGEYLAQGTGEDLSTVTGFVYGDNEWANALQQAIWYLQGQINSSVDPTDPGYEKPISGTALDLANAALLAAQDPMNVPTEVRSLNLYTVETGDPTQSLLILGPAEAFRLTPEPSSLIIWSSLSVVGLAIARVRRRRSA